MIDIFGLMATLPDFMDKNKQLIQDMPVIVDKLGKFLVELDERTARIEELLIVSRGEAEIASQNVKRLLLEAAVNSVNDPRNDPHEDATNRHDIAS